VADVLLQAISNKPGASAITLIDAEPSTTGYTIRSVDLGNAVFDPIYSGQRGTQGAVQVGATPQNRLSSFRLLVRGSSMDDLMSKLTVIWQLDEELRRFGGAVTWRAWGSTYRMTLRALNSAVSLEALEPELFVRNNAAHVVFGVVTPPYMDGEPFDILDDFATNTVANYSFDVGSPSDVSITGGQLLAATAVESEMYYSASGYDYGDQQATVKFSLAGSVSTGFGGVILKRKANGDRIRVFWVSGNLTIQEMRGGVAATYTTVGIAGSVGASYWVRGRIEGNVVTAEMFTAAPSPMATPAATVSYTLTGAQQTVFGASAVGKAGIYLRNGTGTVSVDDFDVDPYTYRNVTLPAELQLNGVIPGDAPALFDVYITPSGGAEGPYWAALGWWPRAGACNLCWNGDFENTLLGSSNWSVAAVTNINGAATSVTRIGAAGKYGSAYGQIVCPATSGTGANFRIFRRFKKGVTYTAEAWIHSPAQTTPTFIRLGNGAAADANGGTAVALSSSWQRITVTWTPSADRDDAHVAININAATATTLNIDGVMVYEGTVAPTTANQTEGRGGFPPLGILEAENTVAGILTSSANFRSGFSVDGNNAPTQLVVDPSLLLPDDYTQAEIAIEVWARCEFNSADSAQIVLAAQPISSLATLPWIYTEEFGSVGRTVVLPASGSARRVTRLGTLRLPTNLGRYAIRINSGIDVDYLLLLPAAARALSPSGRINDVTYPGFIPSTAEITKRVRSDLSATLRETATGTAEVSTSGLGGSLLEMQPGNTDVCLKLSTLVPDNPSLNAATEQLAHSATAHFAITPRWRLGR
jgi:hypothetical protein